MMQNEEIYRKGGKPKTKEDYEDKYEVSEEDRNLTSAQIAELKKAFNVLDS